MVDMYHELAGISAGLFILSIYLPLTVGAGQGMVGDGRKRRRKSVWFFLSLFCLLSLSGSVHIVSHYQPGASVEAK